MSDFAWIMLLFSVCAVCATTIVVVVIIAALKD